MEAGRVMRLQKNSLRYLEWFFGQYHPTFNPSFGLRSFGWLTLLLASACRESPPVVTDVASTDAPSAASSTVATPASNVAQPNVILIVSDTLRADALQLYGNSRESSPQLVKIAQTALIADHMMANAPWTSPAMASMFTGAYPSVHQVMRNPERNHQLAMLSEQYTTLAEAFKQAGYTTGAVSSQPWITADTGFGQGFDTFQLISDKNDRQETEKTFDAAILWLDAHRNQPFFLYVHTMNPHDPYDPPDTFRSRLWPADVPLELKNVALDWKLLVGRPGARRPFRPNADQLKYIRAMYDAEVAYVDQNIGRLAESLAAWGLRNQTALVVTADHGEGFCEHGDFGHGQTLFNENLHVPFIVSYPNLFPAQQRVAHLAQTIDLYPTVAGIANLPVPTHVAGLDLRAPDRSPFVYCEADQNLRYHKIQDMSWSLITTANLKQFRLFHLAEDPQEQHDLTQTNSAELERLKSLLVEHLKANSSNPHRATDRPREMDQKTIDSLKALGYIE